MDNSIFLNIFILFIAGIKVATTLGIAGMGSVTGERSGVLNLGIEGMMLVGAFASYAGAMATGNALAGVLIGMLSASILGIIFAVATVKWKMNQVITSVAVNMVALGLTSALMARFFPSTSGGGLSPGIGNFFSFTWGGVNIGFSWFLLVAIVAVVGVVFMFKKTTWGLQIKAVGDYPKAAATMGVKVEKVRILAVMFTSLMAGLAGAYLSVGDVHLFVNNMTAGKGFIVFACVVFGRFTPLGTLGGCLVFGFAESLKNAFQMFGWDAFIPGGYMTAIMIPYVVTLILLIVSKKGANPTEWAIPYDKADE